MAIDQIDQNKHDTIMFEIKDLVNEIDRLKSVNKELVKALNNIIKAYKEDYRFIDRQINEGKQELKKVGEL